MGPHFDMLFTIVPTLIWLWALWHCFRNRALGGGSRFLWLLFIFFTHIFGAVIYFIFAPKGGPVRIRYPRQRSPQQYYYPSNKRQQQQYYQPSRSQEPYYRPSEPEHVHEEEYQSYQQGYARRVDPPTEQEPIQPSNYNPYEYPQATYPEQTQQQQQ